MSYAVECIRGTWVVRAYRNVSDYCVWTMVCRNRKQADQIAQEYDNREYCVGAQLYIVVSKHGDMYVVHGTCGRKRDTARIIKATCKRHCGMLPSDLDVVTLYGMLGMAI